MQFHKKVWPHNSWLLGRTFMVIHKGEGSRTTRIGLVNRGKIKGNKQKCLIAFLCAEHFYFQDRHLFSCVDPLLLCYKVLNLGRVALF